MAVARNVDVQDVEAALTEFNASADPHEKVHIAAENSSQCCTLTGLDSSLAQVKSKLGSAKWLDLKLPMAYHHQELCKPAADFFEGAWYLQPQADEGARCRFFSTAARLTVVELFLGQCHNVLSSAFPESARLVSALTRILR